MSAPDVPQPRRALRQSLLAGLALLAPGAFAHALDAPSLPTRHNVKLGQRYQISSSTLIHGSCSGCSDQTVGPIPDALLLVDLVVTVDGTTHTQTLSLPGDATFVPPVSGTLERWRAAADPVPPHRRAEIPSGCHVTGGTPKVEVTP
ncbi:MAG: hypothetical protein JNL82_15265 [Myxococcales bacterium]|nr:hypothetical protein [Myxococcales bacterium]